MSCERLLITNGLEDIQSVCCFAEKIFQAYSRNNPLNSIREKLIEITKIHLQGQYFVLKYGEEDNE
jgi:hypothetical protein